MSSDFISSGIAEVLKSGINLRLESDEEESYYISKMCDFFNDKSDFKAYLSGDRCFEIELDRMTPVMEVVIRDSTLSIIPYTEDFFEAFTLILGFIAREHEKIIRELREELADRIESPRELNKFVPKEEKDSDDDYEWV